jgi:hypothetical protein
MAHSSPASDSARMPSAQHLISYYLVTGGGCWAIPGEGKPVHLKIGEPRA